MSAVVLLSAGLDSSYNLFRAREAGPVRLALTFDYGQRAAAAEVAKAGALAARFEIEHRVLKLDWFSLFSRSSLTDLANAVPQGDAVAIDDAAFSRASAKAVWVPNRNGVLLNIAAAFAEGLGAETVVPGFNREEAATFSDNSEEFLRRLDEAWRLSTATSVRAHCYSTHMDKTEIVRDGRRLDLPFSRLWPCYLNGPRWCGTCESCCRYARALAANDLSFAELNGEN